MALVSSAYANSTDLLKKERFSSELYSPNLSQAFLHASPNIDTSRQINSLFRVSSYDYNEGLFAGYQASNGLRLLISSRYVDDNTIFARALFQHPTSGEILPALTTVRDVDENGQPINKVFVGGIDIVKLLEFKNSSRSLSSPEENTLRNFITSYVGEAFMEMIPVMYVKLEQFEVDDSTAALKAPFGLIRQSVEIITNQNGGFYNADESLGKKKADSLREACNRRDCQFKSKQFTIRNNGSFDIISEFNARKKSAQYDDCDPVYNSKLDSFTNSSDECHGLCGLGCIAPGAISTPECISHDNCVDEHGHLECLYNPTEDDSTGESYSSLGEAAASYADELFTPTGHFVGPLPGVDSPYYSPSPGGFCTYDIYCIDNPNPPTYAWTI